jgi:hypothetical protein
MLLLLDADLDVESTVSAALAAVRVCLQETQCKWLTLQLRSFGDSEYPPEIASKVIKSLGDLCRVYSGMGDHKCGSDLSVYVNHMSVSRNVNDDSLNVNVLTRHQGRHFARTVLDLGRAGIKSVTSDELDSHLTPAPPVDLVVYTGTDSLDLTGVLAWMIGFAHIW